MKINMENVNPEAVNKKIKFPTMTYTSISRLGFNSLNRDRNPGHVLNMSKKIRENGFMDIIKVFPPNKDGVYEIAESQHRIESIKGILSNIPSDEIQIPIAVLDWVDSADEDSVIRTIIEMNIGSKGWTVWDYTKTNSNSKTNPNAKDYAYVLQQLKDYDKIVKNNAVAQIYNNGEVPNKSYRKGNFSLDQTQKEFCDQMLYHVNDIIIDFDKKNTSAMFLRSLITVLHKKMNKIRSKFPKNEQLQVFCSYLDYSYTSIENQVSSPQPMPADDEGVEFMLDARANISGFENLNSK